MDHKEHLLSKANHLLNDIGFGHINDPDLLEKLLAPEIMAIGTARDEIYFSIQEVKDMVRRQKEQSAGMNMSYRKEEIYRYYIPGADDAIIVDNITLFLEAGKDNLEISFRFTTVYKFSGENWQVVHFHTSKPENVESETDTFGIDEWKKKTEELEKLVTERTKELQLKNIELSKTIQQLKDTQAQLIQSEKMASLGELTAGIAHEIQNPLNFVNNFSDVNTELIDEAEQHIVNANTDTLREILNDLRENERKINHHGRRADAIVKNMLQHSRASSGRKEPTDINALVEEFLRLAYHGFRAKDKSFNAKFETDLDPAAGLVNLVPQDFSRVILNLVNNAFYAVNEKAREEIPGYVPSVRISTRRGPGQVTIRIADNGGGIPDHIQSRIFQPFFTTKPTGQGTGLGLSLSYDLVTKVHGGRISFETKKGEGTEFVINLPVV
jgi:signal transduction histidine kinase